MLLGTRVFIVEDESLIAMMLEDFLAELDCKVVANSARLDDAVKLARVVEIDVAILDINLAGRMSYPVAEVLLDRNIPFLFATGYGTAGLPDILRKVPVLGKPFMLPQLARALTLAIEAPPSTHPGAGWPVHNPE